LVDAIFKADGTGTSVGLNVGSGKTLAVAGTLTATGVTTLQGLTVGKGAAAVATNTAVGVTALAANTTGATNVAIGSSALAASTTASNNTAVGYQAGYSNTTGAFNTFVGQGAGYASTGNANTLVGQNAGTATTGTNNAFFGAGAGVAVTSGASNTFLGSGLAGVNGSGSAVTTGSKNSILGNYSGNQDSLDIRTASNYVVLSDGDGARQITMKEGQTLALDSAVPNAGTGITFPATQSASADANTLDDYEEGTWTPVLADAASGGNTGTFVNGGATYTKMGRQVTINAYLNAITTTGMTAGNTVFIRGLPFVGNGNFHGNFYSYRVGRNASTVSSCAALTSNVAVYFPLFTTNSATTDLTILVSNVVSGTSEIIFTVTYFV
jgi:hypothetical protein